MVYLVISWFKINFILFKTVSSHKWDNIMTSFENIFRNHDILAGCVESGKIDQILKREPFWDKESKGFLHTRKVYGAVTIVLCTTTHHTLILRLSIVRCAMCMMISRYDEILPTRRHRLCVRAKLFSTSCQKRAPNSLFQYQF